jgi:hypothetical protein
MAVDIYESLHSRNDIRLSKISTALLLARHASPDGVVKMSYRYIAILLKCCKRTAIRHIKYLVEEAEILSKRPLTWIGRKQCDWNVYRFRIKFRRNSAHPYSGDKKAKMSFIPDNAGKERKEDLRTLREDLRRQEKAIRMEWVTPGTQAYEKCQEEIARLRVLLAASPGEPPC